MAADALAAESAKTFAPIAALRRALLNFMSRLRGYPVQKAQRRNKVLVLRPAYLNLTTSLCSFPHLGALECALIMLGLSRLDPRKHHARATARADGRMIAAE